MEIDNVKNELRYVLGHLCYYIELFLDDVMEDSESDPQYSAVTAFNLIICYIRIQKALDPMYPIQTVKEFVLGTQYYSERDYEQFEQKRNSESTYYLGEQYSE